MHTSDPNGSRTQRIKDPEGRGVTSRGRSERPQMILTSPLEVFSGSEQARIHHVPQAGCSHGDRGNVVLRFSQEDPFCSFLCIPGDAQGGSVQVSLTMGFLGSLSSEEERSPWKVPSIQMILLFESLPGKGNEGRWIAQRNPFHTAKRPGTFRPWMGGSQVPSVRPDGIPEGIPPGFLGGALEV
jgi:hypothetical protein